MKMYANIILVSYTAPGQSGAICVVNAIFGGINSSISFIDKSPNAFDEKKKTHKNNRKHVLFSLRRFGNYVVKWRGPSLVNFN